MSGCVYCDLTSVVTVIICNDVLFISGAGRWCVRLLCNACTAAASVHLCCFRGVWERGVLVAVTRLVAIFVWRRLRHRQRAPQQTPQRTRQRTPQRHPPPTRRRGRRRGTSPCAAIQPGKPSLSHFGARDFKNHFDSFGVGFAELASSLLRCLFLIARSGTKR